MPGAGCTHGPPANKKCRRQSPQDQPEQTGIPCAMVLRLIARSPRSTGLDSLRRLRLQGVSAARPTSLQLQA
jgi:hypothetical protein